MFPVRAVLSSELARLSDSFSVLVSIQTEMLSTFLLMLTSAAALYGASTQVFSSKKAEIMPLLLYHLVTVSLHGANHAIQWCAHNRCICWYNCLCLAHYCLALTSFSTVFILVMSIWDIWVLGKTPDLWMTSCCTILGSTVISPRPMVI